MKKRKKTFDILGSCVSRDLFEIPEAVDFECREYIARQSVLSLYAKPLPVTDDEIGALTSNFQKRLILNDFQKTTICKLKESSSDYIIVDFIDERFNVAKISDTFLTMSNELITSQYLNDRKYEIVDKTRWKQRKLEEMLKPEVIRLAKQLADIYKQQHIIIHEAKMVDHYIGKDGNVYSFAPNYIKNNKRVNYVLNEMYIWLKAELPKAAGSIDVTSQYMADESHKWGLSTMHFQPEYYRAVVDEIGRIVNRNNIFMNMKWIPAKK